MKFFKAFYIQNRFYYFCLGVIMLFIIGFIFPRLFGIAKLCLIILMAFTIMDVMILFVTKKGLYAKRDVPEKLSNGDPNPIRIILHNLYTFPVFAMVIDELPFQFQLRDFSMHRKLPASDVVQLQYEVRPQERGEYYFGKLNVYIRTYLGLIARRFTFDNQAMVPTYPSFLQLKKYDLMAFSHRLNEYGIKKIRRIGHTMEFEQIKEYVQGDDIRTINWKATAKKRQLMVNQFQDEKSQPVYAIIDKGRVMKMPFNGLSLLDYAINSTLVISNIILKKQDKAGMFTFSRKVENMVVARRRNSQMQLILENLYNVSTDFHESDYSNLYAGIKHKITSRSLLMLYTNFETLDALYRQLPYLKAMARNHLLVVIFFKNTELNYLIQHKAETLQDVYDKVVAEKFAFEKKLIASELKKYGIHSILTTPEKLTVDSINKYLEMKARGLF